jgi:antirestriction protein ArdC
MATSTKHPRAISRNLYDEVTARILTQLEAGTPPWVREWKSIGRGNVPMNAVTHRPYSGCNVVMLWMAGYPTNRYVTFKQALEVGGSVRNGEHGTKVYFVSTFEKKQDDDNDPRKIPFLKEYTVFNVAQCDGLPESFLTGEAKAINQDERDAEAQEFITVTRADFREGHGEAYYASGADFVSMPHFDAFKDADCFYATSFHELGHWTAHKSRLDRDLRNRFGSHEYAAEELVAELASAFLCAEFDFNKEQRHASYIANWIELLKHDNRPFMTAASKASKAADYLRGLAMREEVRQAA